VVVFAGTGTLFFYCIGFFVLYMFLFQKLFFDGETFFFLGQGGRLLFTRRNNFFISETFFCRVG
jgi:hypothetical protein